MTPSPDHTEQIIGKRYKIINQLGSGGFGQSLLAQDLHLPGCPRCVVKCLLDQKHDPKHLKTARRLFDTEARVLYQLGKHDQIPSLYAHFEENQKFYLVQELVEGEPLTWQIVKAKPWPEERVIKLLRDILEVLAFVHQQNVIHRDIKPSNLIRRQRDGKIVLIDFGAVKQVRVQVADPDSEIADSTVSVGTHGYISNEQLAGRPRFCSDVYAVGIVGIQALTGVIPNRLEEDAATGELAWRVHVSTVSPELAAVLDRMVYYDFRDRYPTAVEALDALKNLPIMQTELSLQAAEADNSDITMQFPSTEFETASTQNDSGPTNVTSNIVQTFHQEDTLAYGDDSPSANALHQSQTVPQPESIPAVGDLAKWLRKQWAMRWAIITAGTAILASTILLLIKLGITPKPTNPSVSRSSVSPSPTVPTTSPTPKPTPLQPEQQAANHLEQADQFLNQRKYQQALDSYDQAIKLKPNLAKAYWGRCESFNGLKQPAKAIVACNDALDINPDYAEAFWSKGKALQQEDRALEALRLFEAATDLKPDFVAAWVARGGTLQEFGRSVEAIDALDQAIALDRNSAEAWSIKGSALWNLGRYDKAIASLDKALQIQPKAPGASALRQKAREELGY